MILAIAAVVVPILAFAGAIFYVTREQSVSFEDEYVVIPQDFRDWEATEMDELWR